MANPLATFDSAWSIIARTHWDPTYNGVNWGLVRDTLRPRAAAARTTAELRPVLAAMVGTLRQSHFTIIPGDAGASGATAARDADERDASGVLGATFRALDGSIVLTSVTSGGPAERAGLRPGFTIEAVDGCRLAPRIAALPRAADPRRARLNMWGVARNMLAGPAGETGRIRARDGRNAERTYAVTWGAPTDSIVRFGNLPPMAAGLAWERRVVSGKNIGVISFSAWMPALNPLFTAAMDSLRGADAIVLDLRGNFGGLGAMSTGIAGHFIDSALTMGTMIHRASIQKFIINPQRVDGRNRRVQPFAGPVALVVDELSISTTEIFAAGMQALSRARVFGEQTAGQALPSIAERLPDGDVLYHAVANFLSPTGQPVEGVGVKPDVTVPLSRTALLRGADAALETALKWAATSAGSCSVPAVSGRCFR